MMTNLASVPLLHIVDLHKRFVLHSSGGRVIEGLRGLDLEVAESTHVCLAGLSGAGKSTLLKCVHRTYLSNRGQIRYRRASGDTVDLVTLSDIEMADLRAAEIGYVSQFLRAEPRRGVHSVVTRAALRMGAPKDEAEDRAAAVLRRVNIAESLWSTYPTMLSGGEKQRVNLAAGIVVPPRLLLLDEPVSALDPANRAAVLELIAELTSAGATVLSVFHDLDAIAQLADVVAVCIDGRVSTIGPPELILRDGLDLEAALPSPNHSSHRSFDDLSVGGR